MEMGALGNAHSVARWHVWGHTLGQAMAGHGDPQRGFKQGSTMSRTVF